MNLRHFICITKENAANCEVPLSVNYVKMSKCESQSMKYEIAIEISTLLHYLRNEEI